MKTAVIVFSTHLKLGSLDKVLSYTSECDRIILLTCQYVFENEREKIEKIIKSPEYVCFADLMTDSDGEKCDLEAFLPYQKSGNLSLKAMYAYFNDLTRMKNQMLVEKVSATYKPDIKLILSGDLGIDEDVWTENGYTEIVCEYYYQDTEEFRKPLYKKLFQKNILHKIAKRFYLNYPENLFVAYYEGKKILFHGHLERAGYRINLDFQRSKKESFKHWIVKLLYVLFRIRVRRDNVINMTTLHEYGNYAFYEMIDIPEFNNYLFQDGMLPVNDCCKYLFFYGKNSHFYTWDKLGNKVFEYHNIPAEILPFRNTFSIPEPNFKKVKNVLCVSSGAGDWTAIKNRSDEDKTVAAIVEMAKRHPEIQFVYRCHPSWVNPTTQGVNSIQRLYDYFDWLNLPNIRVSSNIPSNRDKNGSVVVSHKRSSLDSDLKDADFVFGVHSISMIDGAMKNIPFASVNLSGRRNLWQGISDLGFPNCEDLESIEKILTSVESKEFQEPYLKAVAKYNQIISEQ